MRRAEYIQSRGGRVIFTGAGDWRVEGLLAMSREVSGLTGCFAQALYYGGTGDW